MIKRLFFILATCPNNLPTVRHLSSKTMQSIPNVTRFNGGIIRFLGQNPGCMTLQGTNSYLIGNSQSRLLLDTSDPNKTAYIELLEKVLEEEKAKITTVVLTHWHTDHIGALNNLRERNIIDDNCKVWKFPRSDLDENFDELRLSKLIDNHQFTVDENIKLRAIHTPGHTTDHAIIFNENDKTLYSGDCILGEGTAVFEDLYDYMNSLRKILELKPEKIYPGHGNVIEGAVEKIQYYISHRQERERQILEVLSTKSPQTVMGIVEVIYRETPENLWKAAAFNVHHHLTKLKKEEKVNQLEKDNEEYWEISLKSNKL